MQENSDFILVRKVDMNEGLSTGTITKAALFFTASYMFVVPFESIAVLGYKTEKSIGDIADLILTLIPQLKDQSVEDFELQMIGKLPPERVYEIADLETFSVNVGWWIFGGMTIQKKGGSRQTINVQPTAMRTQISQFYRT